MAFPKRLLNEGEEVVLDLRPHWASIFWPMVIPVVVIVLTIVDLQVLGNGSQPRRVLAVLLVVVLLLSVVRLVLRYLKWTNTNFVVTTDRLVYRSGVVSKQGKEIPLDRINDISFHQSVFERLLGAGNLTIESAGTSGQETFADIRKPSVVQNTIYKMMETEQNRRPDRSAGRRELSLPEQLDKLDELRQRGVLSQSEFDQKKAQILDRM